MKYPFIFRGGSQEDIFPKGKWIVMISGDDEGNCMSPVDPGFMDQEHRKEFHPESFDHDFGDGAYEVVCDEHDAEKHVFDTEEEVKQFVKEFWAKQ